MNRPKFSRFSNVKLRRAQNQGGMIVKDPIDVSGGWQYFVQFSISDRRWVDEKDLVPFVQTQRTHSGDLLVGTHRDLLLHLLLLKIRDPIANVLYGVKASRTKFVPYQFKPALKFLENPNQRLLIADEVGLGKTIEAGIIYQELKARTDLDRVLVVCPSALRHKWRDELLNRFQEDFAILDTKSFATFMDDYDRLGDQVRLKGIASLEALRRAEIAERIAERQYDFNLVIVDEAHHMRNHGTRSNDLGTTLSDLSDGMLLLTATPLQVGNQDLFELLHILAPGDFDEFSSFEERIEPNKFINGASSHLSVGKIPEALKEITQLERISSGRRLVSNPNYIEAKNILQGTATNKEAMVKAQEYLLNLNTLSHIFTRTRKREVDPEAPMRRAFTLKVRFTAQEQNFYKNVIRFAKSEYQRNSGNMAVGWASIMRERQAASSVQAMKRKYLENYSGYQKLDIEEQVALDEGFQYANSEEEEISPSQVIALQSSNNLRDLIASAEILDEIDTKFEVFFQNLQTIVADNPTGKILIFSYFLDTLNYLRELLSRRGYGPLLISGSVPMDIRNGVLDRFQNEPECKILLSSEVGSEGLDFQFCDTIINYDLPWNPMKVEQRIGRLDRYGQKAKVIKIYNLVIEDSIEERIFSRLYERIEIFKATIGDLEAILGEEIRNITRVIYSRNLTAREEEELADKAGRAILRAKRELEEFERNKLHFMGQDAIFSGKIEERIKSGRFISSNEVVSLVESFLTKVFARRILRPNSDGGETFSFVPDLEFQDYAKTYLIKRRVVGRDQTYLDFLGKLEPGKAIPLTFSDEIAFSRKPLEFINLNHPLAEMAMDYWLDQDLVGLPISRLVFQGDYELSGEFFYFLYKYSFSGAREGIELRPVVVEAGSLQVHDQLSERFLPILQNSVPVKHEFEGPFDEHMFEMANDVADLRAAKLQAELSTDLERQNNALINAKLFAIDQSFEQRKLSLERLRKVAKDERILRMRDGQMRNNYAKYLRSKEKIEKNMEIMISHSLDLAGHFYVNTLPSH